MDSLQRIITSVCVLFALAVYGGVVFAALAHPRREALNRLLSGYAVAAGVWAAFVLGDDLLGSAGGVSWSALRLVALVVSAVLFHWFARRLSDDASTITGLLLLASPVAVIAAVVLSAQAFEADDATLTVPGLVVVGVAMLYWLSALWSIFRSPAGHVFGFRIPAFGLLVACALYGVPVVRAWAGDVLLAAVSAGGAAWMLVAYQVVKPFEELTAEVRTANRDLRQAVNDLATEKARIETLSATASGTKSAVLANMSHKLRTPLNSMVGYTDLLQSGIYGELNEKQMDRVTKIYRNGQMLLELINYMVDLSNMEAGRFELNLASTAMDAVLATVEQATRVRVEERGLALTVRADAGLPVLYADAKRVEQVVVQLVENAIKFTREGEIEVTAVGVSVQRGVATGFKLPVIGWLGDGEWVLIAVRDTGIGIAPEDQARVFDEFYQVDEQAVQEMGGTGLGLAVSKRLVEMHHGVIWVKSLMGQGSTFYVALPVQGAGVRAGG